MSLRRGVELVTVVAVFLGIIWSFGEQPGRAAPAELTGQDYEEIKALYARYNQGSDFRDADLFLSAFAENATMTRGGRDIVGMEALRAERRERYQGQTGDVGRRHVNGSYLITATEDGAKSRAYYVLLDVTTRPPTLTATGYYDDEFIRTGEGWRIKHRTLHSDPVTE